MRKQDREADRRMHESKMKLLGAIRKSVEHPSENKTIGALLEEATALQRAQVRAHLQEQITKYSGASAPIEVSVAQRALKAFDASDYGNGHIARYLTKQVIEKIFVD